MRFSNTSGQARTVAGILIWAVLATSAIAAAPSEVTPVAQARSSAAKKALVSFVKKLIRPEKKQEPSLEAASKIATAKTPRKDQPRTERKTTRKAHAAKT